MKKIIPTLMALVLVLSMFTACSQTDKTAGTDDNKSSSTTDSDIPDNDEIATLFEKAQKLLIMYLNFGGPSAVSEEFGEYEQGDLIIEKNNTIIKPTDYDWKEDYGGRAFIITNIKYQQALDKYSELFAGDLLNEFMTSFFYNYNGALCIYNGGGIDGYSMANITITYVNELDGEYNYTVNYDSVVYNNATDISEHIPYAGTFSIKYTDSGYRMTHPTIDLWNQIKDFQLIN